VAIKISDLGDDGWLGILAKIRRGEHPKLDDLLAALRRQEPGIPGEAQLYLARLLSGDIDRRGRPTSALTKTWRAGVLVIRVHRWHRVFRDRHHVPDPQRRAFEQVAVERRWKNAQTAERKYRQARSHLRSTEDAPGIEGGLLAYAEQLLAGRP
jgi:hypothetical protein